MVEAGEAAAVPGEWVSTIAGATLHSLSGMAATRDPRDRRPDEPTEQVDAEAVMTARLRGRSLEVLISELSAPLRSTRSAVEQRA